MTEDAILTHDNDSWTGVSRYPPTRMPSVGATNGSASAAAGISVPAGGQPATYNVQVSGNKNDNGYATVASKVEATYPAVPQQANAQGAGSVPAAKPAAKPQASASGVEYVVPPPSQIFDASSKSLEPTKQAPAALQRVNAQTPPQQQPQTPKVEGVNTPIYPQSVPVVATNVTAPAGPKIPSAKNYPIDLIWLAESRKTGLKILKTSEGHQLMSDKTENQPTEKQPETPLQSSVPQQQQPQVQQQQQWPKPQQQQPQVQQQQQWPKLQQQQSAVQQPQQPPLQLTAEQQQWPRPLLKKQAAQLEVQRQQQQQQWAKAQPQVQQTAQAVQQPPQQQQPQQQAISNSQPQQQAPQQQQQAAQQQQPAGKTSNLDSTIVLSFEMLSKTILTFL